MGVTSAWAISAHHDTFIDTLAPRMLPLIVAERAAPEAQRQWRRWQDRPLPDWRAWGESFGCHDETERADLDSFVQLTTAGEHMQELYSGGDRDDPFWIVDDVWERGADPDRMFFSAHRKDYAVASLFHAIGPSRAALLPGWCGNFLLTSAQIRQTLPLVERALGFTPEERIAAEEQDRLDYSADEESVLDGPLRQWRDAAAAGLGLCGAALHLY
ncbi:hypothetical protein [Streptomyces coffeae]|uniref:SMI1/KNR4 family protein n=1 Tax=Streptomyces coffeae TaxID=621382 RepID=A0ABS1NC93_9ACTN|nr:hypothetical protein [Streptomyces coffeae]MBL1097560.1 hypothetical protein [Streptomyces coffeae]